MAHFYQKQGSPGHFYTPNDNQLASSDADKGKATLTIRFGETAEVILWGKGPVMSGSTSPADLKVVPKSAIPFRASDPVPISPLEQLVRVTPDATGDILLYARIGDERGLDWAAPLRIVTIAEHAPTASRHLILCSSSEIADVRKKIKWHHLNASAIVCNSAAQFGATLRSLRDQGQKVSKLEIYGHGNVGFIFFGDDAIGRYAIEHLKGQGLDRIFAPNAAIFLHNCWVGGSEAGNEFLIAFAQVFLSGGGGTVGAANSMALPNSLDPSGTAWHFWGATKRLWMAPGGKIIRTENFDAGTSADHAVVEGIADLAHKL